MYHQIKVTIPKKVNLNVFLFNEKMIKEKSYEINILPLNYQL